jgi:hypothetical protein
VFQNVPTIRCSSETGVVESSIRKKISFYIVPEDIGLFESFWQFQIKQYDLQTLLLIVINVTQPSISYRKTLIKLETLVTGKYFI